MDRADILTALRDRARLEDLQMCEAQSLSRMRETQIKICVAHTENRKHK